MGFTDYQVCALRGATQADVLLFLSAHAMNNAFLGVFRTALPHTWNKTKHQKVTKGVTRQFEVRSNHISLILRLCLSMGVRNDIVLHQFHTGIHYTRHHSQKKTLFPL